MITLHQLSKYYGKQDVLNRVDLHVGPGERLGLVGPNGAGKSTILSLMLGDLEPDEGEVFRTQSLRIGYLPQDLLRLTGRTVLELAMDTSDRLAEIEAELQQVHRELSQETDPQRSRELLIRQGRLTTHFEGMGGYDLEARASKALAGLGFKPEQYGWDLDRLSGGWLMRAALARILLSQPDLILLDEPTNHLDLESMLWLEGELIKSPASLVMVSHDRVFLDKVVNRIVEVEDAKLYTYGGNYSNYLEQRQARRKAQQAAYDNQQERIRQVMNFVDRNRTRKDRAKQVQSRLKMLEQMEKVKPPSSDEAPRFELPPAEPSAKVVVEVMDAKVAYEGKVVYEDLNFLLRQGMRLAVLGRNGEGKSTLLKVITGRLRPKTGRWLLGGRVKIGMFSQHAMEELNPDNEVLQELATVGGHLGVGRLRNTLGSFLFQGDDVFKRVKVLSGGERSRLVIAKLLLQGPNLLLLDEPTNHLDLVSCQVLEEALRQYNGTLVLVSHDRHLINSVADHVAYVADGQVTMLPGNYDDFIRLWRAKLEPSDDEKEAGQIRPKASPDAPAAAPTEKAATKNSGRSGSGPKDAATKRAEAKARNERYRRARPLKDQVDKEEKLVEEISAQLDRLSAEMADPEVYRDGERFSRLSQEYAEIQRRLERHTARWEKLALELEELESE
jgi:ATP-binding cassette subfamily F protein 3